MSYLIPEDGYSTYLSQSLSSVDTTAYVNALPVAVTAGYLTIFELDGSTIRAKIKFTGVASSPSRLTGVSFVSLTAVSDTPVTGTDCPKNSKAAITDNIQYLGRALNVLNGTDEMGGVMKLPTVRTISNSRDVVDKEYADAVGSVGYGAFNVAQNGADPSLTVNIAAGQYIKSDGSSGYFAGSAAVAVTANQTNYVEMDNSGSVSVNTSAFTSGRLPLAVVVTDASDITSISDRRALLGLNDGTVDKIRTWTTVQTFAPANLQINADPSGANDAVRKSYLEDFLFGTGVDGDVTISVPTQLTSDKHYNNLTLNDDIDANSYKIFVRGTLTRADGKKIYNNGANGGAGGNSAGAFGAAGAAGTKSSGSLRAPADGKIGATGNYRSTNGASVGLTGTAGTAQTSSIGSDPGVAGGAGGSGDTGSNLATAGAAGAAGTYAVSSDKPTNIFRAMNLVNLTNSSAVVMQPTSGSGAGGSGGVSTAGGGQGGTGGGGGSATSGGIVLVAARSIVIQGTGTFLESKGGVGGAAGTPGIVNNGTGCQLGGSGGGGGGPGGTIIVIYNSLSGSIVTDVTGGAGGAKSAKASYGTGSATDGADGATGGNGQIYTLVV